MRHRTMAVLFGAAAATGAAAIGAGTAALYGRRADEQHRRTYQALSRAFFTWPESLARTEAGADGQRPELVLVKGGSE